MKTTSRSDKGRRRSNNEDSVCIDAQAGIFILADGMGGHRAGEVASDIAVREAHLRVKEKISGLNGHPNYQEYLLESFTKANNAVRLAALMDKSLTGMGTTLLLAIVENGKAHIGNVGDSRAYLVRESMRQLTKDQTVGAFLVEHNLMPLDEIDPGHWHVLTQAVGGSAEDLAPEFIEMSIQKGDILLLCSDGLTDMVSDKEIEQIFAGRNGDLNHLADSLVNAANSNGGRDNISVIIIEFE